MAERSLMAVIEDAINCIDKLTGAIGKHYFPVCEDSKTWTYALDSCCFEFQRRAREGREGLSIAGIRQVEFL